MNTIHMQPFDADEIARLVVAGDPVTITCTNSNSGMAEVYEVKRTPEGWVSFWVNDECIAARADTSWYAVDDISSRTALALKRNHSVRFTPVSRQLLWVIAAGPVAYTKYKLLGSYE